MAEPYLGEIRIMSFSFAPRYWALCNGQLLPINQNQALFALLGNRFGGNGTTNFALPDLRGRMPLHMGQAFSVGQAGGTETHTLTVAEMPQHSHTMRANTALANTVNPANALPGTKGRLGRDMFAPPGNVTTLNPASLSAAGGSQPHENMQPYLALNFAIALAGIFPSQN